MRLFSWLKSARTERVPAHTRLGVEVLEDRAVPAVFVVQNLADAGAGSLRQAVLDANASAGADVVRFAVGVHGTVTLTSGELAITDDLLIDGPGAARLAVSGNDTSRVFNIGTGAEVAIDELTVTRGRAMLRGGGVRNDGTLTLTGAVVSDNVVVGLPGAVPTVAALGGGIYNSGTLTVLGTTFARNQSLGATGNPGGPGSAGIGGAVCSFSLDGGPPANATIGHCVFVDNRAVGGAAGAGGTVGGGGVGGAIQNDNSAMTVSHSLFRDNRAVGGAGGTTGGFAAGGAITNAARFGNTSLTVTNSLISGNTATGGAGTSVGGIGRGGGIANFVAFQAPLGAGFTATTAVANSAVLGNTATGGVGTIGGTGQGGGITNENGGTLTVTGSMVLLNDAVGGAGNGNGLGGGIFNGPTTPYGVTTVNIERSVIALNEAVGIGTGGGVYIAPGSVATANRTLIFANDASTRGDVFGILV